MTTIIHLTVYEKAKIEPGTQFIRRYLSDGSSFEDIPVCAAIHHASQKFNQSRSGLYFPKENVFCSEFIEKETIYT